MLATTGAGAAEQRLGEVVVTAPAERTEAAPADVTAFGTVIDTASAPATVETLAEALSETVGVQVRRFGGLGEFSTVSVRGFAPGQVQVYLDGVPLSRADNETVNLSDLPLDAVDHVEVYRGATPLAFAQAGPGGVINVVTRRPEAASVTAASASWGSFDTRKVDLARAATVGAWDYLAFAHYLGSEGDFTFTNDRGTPSPADDRTERRRNNAFDLGDATARVGYRGLGPFAIALTSDTFVKDQGVPGRATVQSTGANLHTLRELAHLDATLAPPAGFPLEASASAYVLHQQQDFEVPLDDPAFVPTDSHQQTTAAGAQALVRGALGTHNVPGLFVAASHERFAERDPRNPFGPFPDRTRVRGTVAAEDEVLLLGERVSLVPGLRWEVFRDAFPGNAHDPTAREGGVRVRDFLSPRLGLRAEVRRGLTLLANVGRYAREPNLQELFGTSGVVRGNPKLRPEVSFNRDAGFRLSLPPLARPLTDVALEYAYFDNAIDDLIVLVPSGVSVFRPANVASARVQGHEVVVRGRLWARITLSANYTHQRAIEDSDIAFRNGKQLPGRPADEAYARAELAWSPSYPLPLGAWAARLWPGRLFYDVNLIADNFLDRANTQRVGSRALHGAGVELGLPLPRTRVTFELKNAGDDRTSDALGFPLPGRTFFATVSYGFGREGAGRGEP